MSKNIGEKLTKNERFKKIVFGSFLKKQTLIYDSLGILEINLEFFDDKVPGKVKTIISSLGGSAPPLQ